MNSLPPLTAALHPLKKKKRKSKPRHRLNRPSNWTMEERENALIKSASTYEEALLKLDAIRTIGSDKAIIRAKATAIRAEKQLLTVARRWAKKKAELAQPAPLRKVS